MNADGFASSLVMRERGWGPGMRTHSSSKRTPRASTLSVTVMDRGLDIAIEICGEDRCLSCHARHLRRSNGLSVGVAGGGFPGPRFTGATSRPIAFPDWMAPSERLEQITNHLSNNYSRGLLNGDVAIITGNPFSVWHPPALRSFIR
jgi:hypothetical protein